MIKRILLGLGGNGPIRQLLFSMLESACAADGVKCHIKQEENKDPFDLMISLGRIEGSELHVTHCWRLYAETILLHRGGMS